VTFGVRSGTRDEELGGQRAKLVREEAYTVCSQEFYYREVGKQFRPKRDYEA
jgi:hypothetical protein